MKTYNYNDEEFKNTSLYQDFIKENPGSGNLRIRAYAANQAVPISNMKVVVSSIYQNNNIIFFEGYTNESGVIERINLPAPTIENDDLNVPKSIIYDVSVSYIPDNINQVYKVNMYDDICVIQNINIVPNTQGDA